MQAIQWIISACMTISWHFFYVYLDVSGWWPPFNLIAPVFLWISDAFIDLAANFTSFSAWVYWAQDWIGKILTWDYILSLIQPYIQPGINAYNWIVNAFWNVWDIVTQWWLVVSVTVQGWIAAATEGFNALKVAFDNFWTYTLPNLFDYFKLESWWTGKLFDIDGLIGSKLTEWFPWYSTLVSIKDELFEFFADPLDWIYNKLDDFFERFW